ncbi:MAG TPA: hypothetical protein VIM12_15160 [Noviherbaspirillum sp.]|jgi:hypothetical protein|uniref:hypothetical protein n=1 Tax=Noviherbaspirillum sp. TaxID=1926288 RepID=UPI002F935183
MTIRHLALAAVLVLAPPIAAAAGPQCADNAVAQARKLLAFHVGDDDRISVDKPAKELPSMRNPANPAQRFIVLEVWGAIYKGQYRMRFLYYPLQDECVLMGQEILEYARL